MFLVRSCFYKWKSGIGNLVRSCKMFYLRSSKITWDVRTPLQKKFTASHIVASNTPFQLRNLGLENWKSFIHCIYYLSLCLPIRPFTTISCMFWFYCVRSQPASYFAKICAFFFSRSNFLKRFVKYTSNFPGEPKMVQEHI